MLNDYLTSKDINFNLYSTYIIKEYIETNQENKNYAALELLLSQISKEELIILTSLLNKDNKRLSYTTLYILINIRALKDAEKLFYLDENICCNIASFSGNNKKDDILLKYGIMLIRNLTVDKNICEIFNKYKITEFYEEIYERHLLDNKIMDYLTYSICSIIGFEAKKQENKKNASILLPCIRIIATQLRPNYEPSRIHRYIYRIYELSDFKNPELYFQIINSKIHKELMEIYPKLSEKCDITQKKLDEINSSKNLFTQDQIAKLKEDNEYYYYACLLILKILGKLMGKDDGILLQTLLNADISSFLKPLILTNDLRTIKNVSFCFSNICSGTYGQVGYLFNNNALYELIKVGKNIYEAMELSKEKDDYYFQLKDTLREINYVFALTITNSIFEKSVPFAKCYDYTPIKILVKSLKIYCDVNNQEFLCTIVRGLVKLIYFNNFFEENICDVMEKFGFKENLEYILQNENWEIFEDFERIYDSIFGFI